MGVQSLSPELGVKRFDEGVVGRFSRAGEVEDYAALIGPQLHFPLDKLAAIADSFRSRIANPAAHLVTRGHHNFASITEPWINDRGEPRESIDHSQHPQLAARGGSCRSIACVGFVCET